VVPTSATSGHASRQQSDPKRGGGVEEICSLGKAGGEAIVLAKKRKKMSGTGIGESIAVGTKEGGDEASAQGHNNFCKRPWMRKKGTRRKNVPAGEGGPNQKMIPSQLQYRGKEKGERGSEGTPGRRGLASAGAYYTRERDFLERGKKKAAWRKERRGMEGKLHQLQGNGGAKERGETTKKARQILCSS